MESQKCQEKNTKTQEDEKMCVLASHSVRVHCRHGTSPSVAPSVVGATNSPTYRPSSSPTLFPTAPFDLLDLYFPRTSSTFEVINLRNSWRQSQSVRWEITTLGATLGEVVGRTWIILIGIQRYFQLPTDRRFRTLTTKSPAGRNFAAGSWTLVLTVSAGDAEGAVRLRSRLEALRVEEGSERSGRASSGLVCEM
jgi:hypothetical protein